MRAFSIGAWVDASVITPVNRYVAGGGGAGRDGTSPLAVAVPANDVPSVNATTAWTLVAYGSPSASLVISSLVTTVPLAGHAVPAASGCSNRDAATTCEPDVNVSCTD